MTRSKPRYTDELKPTRTSARVQRILNKKEPQLIESTKKCIVMKGHKTSETITKVLQDIAKLLKPNVVSLSRKNEILPFEDSNSIEFLSQKNDCSLFTIGSHTKKRPNNLIMGRTFDGHVLDMIEFGVDSFQSISSFTGMKKTIGSKPLLAFLGSQWETDSLYTRIQNFFLDFFRGTKFDMINLQGIDNLLVFTVIDGKIYMRGNGIAFKKSGTKIPNVKLIPMGPYLNLSLRRNQVASEDMWKAACKQAKSTATPKKVKNISKSIMGDKVGRIHMKKQNLDKMGVRKVSALRNRNKTDSRDSFGSNTASSGGGGGGRTPVLNGKDAVKKSRNSSNSNSGEKRSSDRSEGGTKKHRKITTSQ